MRGFFQRLGNSLQRFMYGRYGNDSLNTVLMICGMVLVLLSALPYCDILYAVAAVLWGFAIFRTYSRNINKRQRELYKFKSITSGIGKKADTKKKIWNERKTHRYFKCKNCKTILRVPKGKGKIKISCPKCRTEIIKKT